MDLPDVLDIHKGQYAPRVIPHNIEAEQALLGALLIDNRAVERVVERLEAAHFYDPLHASIYDTICRYVQAGRPADPIALRSVYQSAPPIDEHTTVPIYLGRLVAAAPGLIHVAEYARTIVDLAARRDMIAVAESLLEASYDAPIDTPAETIAEGAERGLFEIVGKRAAGRELTFAQAMHAAVETISTAYKRGGDLAGIPTGLIDLDRLLGGLQPSDLIILGGRPSMGKTALAVGIGCHVASHPAVDADGVVKPQHVHIFSQEMSASQLAMRLISDRAEIASEKLRRGQINEEEFKHVIARVEAAVAQTSMTVDETGGITLGALAAKARRIKRKHGTALMIIDYLQLMSGAGKGSDNRVQEITKLTTGLKALAKELDVPILALSQLSRKVEERADKRPQLSDLRESGSIEQDADVVMFVYRDEYYVEREQPDHGTSEHQEWQARMQRAFGKAEVIIAKQRHGPIGTVMLSFQSQFTRFGNLAMERAQ